jgi:Protein of unknown function (DUF3027)
MADVKTAVPPKPDAVCNAAVDLARAAAVDVAGDRVGEHLTSQADGDRLVTHFFRAHEPGYRGWRWAVTVTRAPRSRQVTVDEVALLPGPDSILAPEWVPWSERLRPGDLGVGDLLPTEPDDDRLAPAYLHSDEQVEDELAYEWGVGKPRVMSRTGRTETAERWYHGDAGPEAPIARAAPAHCGSCGFWLPLAGSMRQLFGVCGNEFAPDDGKVVAADHGCGAHSEALVEPAQSDPGPVMYDDTRIEFVPREHAPGSVNGGGEEPLGHS